MWLRTKIDLEGLLQADCGCVPERFLLSARTKSITENSVYWKLHLLFVFVVFQCIFSYWALASMHFTIFIQELSILLFSFVKKSWIFLSVMELSCLKDKQNNTWLLVDMKFLLSCPTRAHLWDIEFTWTLEEKFHIYACPYIILYLTQYSF